MSRGRRGSSTGPAEPVPKAPARHRTAAMARIVMGMAGLREPSRGGNVAPSRSAATGAIRVARRAGERLATRVTTMPSPSATMTVRVSITVLACGRSMPKAWKSAFRPFASARPSTRPTTEANTPIARPSVSTERLICRREAPSVRSVASSRMRWASVIDRVLKITNAPTPNAMNPKPSRKHLDELGVVLGGLGIGVGLLLTGLDLRGGRHHGSQVTHDVLRGDALASGDEDRVELAALAQQRLRGGHVEDGDRRAADRVDRAVAGDAR